MSCFFKRSVTNWKKSIHPVGLGNELVYFDGRPDVLEESPVLSEDVIPVDLKEIFGTQIFPVSCIVGDVSVDQ